jgi:hypothetical protein
MGRRSAISLLLGAAMLAATASCFAGRTGPEPAITSLVVRNRGFFDVNVYVLPSFGGSAQRLGTVIGLSTMSFPLRRSDLHSGGSLSVRVHAIGTRSSWTSDAVAINEGLVAVLNVVSDPFGDCSQSSLYTILIGDSLTARDRSAR